MNEIRTRLRMTESSIWRVYDATLKPVYGSVRRGAIWTLERRARIRTTGIITPEELGFTSAYSVRYEASRWNTLKCILRRREVGPTDVFIDFGAGMGRVLYQAAMRYPFHRVEGVELSPELTAVARENLDRHLHRFRCGDVRVVTCDALDYEVPDDLTIAYFYNPFNGPVFASVIDRLVESVQRRPRRLRVVYLNPVEEQRLLDAGFREVRRLRGLRPGQWRARMYELSPASGHAPHLTTRSRQHDW